MIIHKSKNITALILSALGLVLVSWYRAYVAGTLMVDGHGLAGVAVIIVFAGFVGALLTFSFSFYQLWKADTLDHHAIRLLAYPLVVIFSAMLPLLSNDIFSLIAFGDAANHGADVYATAHAMSLSPYAIYITELHRSGTFVYGPICLYTAQIAAWLGHGHIIYALLAYKIICILWAAVFIECCYKIAQWQGVPNRNFLFIICNPLFLIQAVGQLHCDEVAIAFSVAMFYTVLRERWLLAFTFCTLAVAVKMSFVLLFPFVIVALFISQKDYWQSTIKLLMGLVLAIALLIAIYLPVYSTLTNLATPFHTVFEQTPTKSIAEAGGYIINYAPQLFHYTPSDNSNAQLLAWNLMKYICQLAALLLSATVFFRFLKSEKTIATWTSVFLRLLLLFLFLYSHVYYPWYLLVILPFLWYERDVNFRTWLFVITCATSVIDLVAVVDRTTIVYYLILGFTMLHVALFFWKFRRVYFLSLRE